MRYPLDLQSRTPVNISDSNTSGLLHLSPEHGLEDCTGALEKDDFARFFLALAEDYCRKFDFLALDRMGSPKVLANHDEEYSFVLAFVGKDDFCCLGSDLLDVVDRVDIERFFGVEKSTCLCGRHRGRGRKCHSIGHCIDGKEGR